jgi:outer membrane protein assembly factor BamB
MRIFTALSCAALALITALATAKDQPAQPDPLDWPNWRGPAQDRISRETGLPDSLDFTDGSKVLAWKNREAAGISTPIVMRGKLYTIVRAEPTSQREQEEVLCLDAATGEKRWGNRFNVYLSDVPAERVGWSCCVGDPETGRVYAMGVNGYFQCLDGETGKPIWSRSLLEEFGLLSTYGGRTNVPVLFDDLVIISAVMTDWGDMAVPAHRFLGLDKNTGEVVWFNGTRPRPEDTTYSTPMVTVIDGQAALVFGSGDGGLYAFQPRTGKPIWNCQLSRRGINVSPLVADDKVYIGQSEENTDDTSMGLIACVNGKGSGDITKTNFLWRHKEVMVGKSTPLLFDGRLYAVDDSAALFVFDAASGKPVGRKQKFGTIMRASLLGADGKIYVPTNTTWAIVKPTADGFKKLAQGRLQPEEECQGSPIVSHGRLYWPTTFNLYCFYDPDKKHGATPAAPPPHERPASEDQTPVLAQLKPCEVLLRPGDTQKFAVRLFNSRGQFLRESEAVFEAKGGGRIGSDGVLHTEQVSEHTAIFVTAKAGELSATARVRVVPPLPWKFDFAAGDVPITWIGARYRHVVRTVDGNPVMVKVTTIPKGTRSQCWMGQTDLHDYTIQADMLGNQQEGKLPDMGLIAQRYTLDLMGASQQLQIRSWTSTLNRSKTIAFAWKPNVWYTMKFRAQTVGDKVILEGKVWERGKSEPREWTISMSDPVPNLSGSPGLFGNATNAEIYIDNISVTPNDLSLSKRP